LEKSFHSLPPQCKSHNNKELWLQLELEAILCLCVKPIYDTVSRCGYNSIWSAEDLKAKLYLNITYTLFQNYAITDLCNNNLKKIEPVKRNRNHNIFKTHTKFFLLATKAKLVVGFGRIQVAGWPSCGRSGCSVLETGFQLDSLR